MKLTKQGVRDLGNSSARPRGQYATSECAHVWDDIVGRDRYTGECYWYKSCGACHAIRD